MIGRSTLGLVLAAFALMVAVPTASAQEGEGPSLPARYSEPISLYSAALGSFTRPISSSNAEAQAYFDQGFQLRYAFAPVEAVRSFREAWKRDPTCAICYWGEAWALGSFLNGPMRANQAPHAYAAIQKALALAEDHASPSEKAFIDAMAVRYVENFDPDKRREQDTSYAEAMRLVAERYPDDLEAATFYADALFLLEPRRGTRDLNDPNVVRLHRVLEGVLDRDIRHLGACHLYIHATESTIRPDKAGSVCRVSGQRLSGSQPHQPHALPYLERGGPLG